jgi:hypothetical protein
MGGDLVKLFRRRRAIVRLHLEGSNASVEGLFLGYAAGHYRLVNARHLEAADQSIPLEGEAWVPKKRVLYAQVIG